MADADPTMTTGHHKSTDVRMLALIGISMALALGAVPSLLWYFLPTLEARGQFGDMFGLTNSLFSGCAFAGLIYTIVLQRRELTLQRQELALTRAELARSATAQEKAERALTAQVRTANQSARLTAIAHLLEYHDRQIARTDLQMTKNPRISIGTDSPRQREYLARALERMSKELVAEGDLPEDPGIRKQSAPTATETQPT